MKNSQERAAVARQSDARTTSKHDVNLSKNNVVYFQIGLIVALILAIVVIEIKSPAAVYEPEVLPDVAVLTMDEWNEPIRREEVKPKPPKPIEIFDVPPVIDENVPEPIDDLIFEEPEPVTEAVPGLEDLKDIPDEEPESVPFIAVETVPVYPGCEGLKTNAERKACMQEKLNAFIGRNFDTTLGEEYGLSGVNRVDVQFTIDEYGEIINLKTRAPHPALEKEAKRVMNKLPVMEPGKQRNRNVRVIYSQPIRFKVQN